MIRNLGAISSTMKLHKLLLVLMSTFWITGFTACQEAPDFPMEPTIEYKGNVHNVYINEQNVVFDTIQHIIRFRDGDGNIGLGRTDSPNERDYFSEFYVKINGAFRQVYIRRDGTYTLIQYYNRIPRISMDERKEPLEGDIKIGGHHLRKGDEIFYLLNNVYQSHKFNTGDVVKFDFYIMDRAKNKSNKIESPDIVLRFN